MISLYRLFGGLALLLLGLGYFYPLPKPLTLALGVFLIVAGVALLAGM